MGTESGSAREAPAHGGAVALSDVVTREQYKTAEGRSASAYRTRIWASWPLLKNLTTLLACSSSLFVVGPGIVAGALWACPRPVAWVAGAAYSLHVLFGNAMHTGSLESFWWKGLDLHMAVMEYFGYRLLVEDDLVLRPDRKYVIGTHPHGVYALGQLPFMFTSRHNPLFQLFPFLKNKVHGTGASVVFYIPGIREMFLLAGHVVVSKKTLVRWLQRGHSVGIVVGGEAECLAAANNQDALVLGGRKGFVRLALTEGADLLPTYCFHNTDVFSINTSLLQGRPHEFQQKTPPNKRHIPPPSPFLVCSSLSASTTASAP
jgi:2-acylglycerol O-acyltransferase 2